MNHRRAQTYPSRRVAIYARYSSDLQREASITDQVRLCRERAERDDLSIVEVFSDRAISGASMHNRPGFLDLMEKARQGAFDVVIAEALDRLSRDQEDIAAIHKRLTYAGITLVTLAEGEINELHVGLKGTMNALFLKDLAQKTRRGQRGCVEDGRIPGGKSYGYRIVRRLRDNGTYTTGEREIAADEAAVVRRIFADYAQGISPREIAARLNKAGIPSPRGGLWNASTINGSRQRRNGILNNELYLGRIVYNRQRFAKDPDSGRRLSQINPEEQWVTSTVPALQIIDLDLWDAVQNIKARYSSHRGNKRQTRKRLLTGLVRCGACGGAMTIVNRERYYCSAKRERGTCSSAVGIKAAELEERVLRGLSDILLGQEALIEAFVTEFNKEVARLRKSRTADERQAQDELSKLTKSISRCLAFITGGDGDPGLVRDELTRLQTRKSELDRQLEARRAVTVVEPHPNTAELYRRRVTQLQTLLADETSKAQAMASIRSLIERIEVHEGKTRSQPDVLLVGALAGILDYAWSQQQGPKTQNAASCGDGGRILLVAGVGFEPTTFRL